MSTTNPFKRIKVSVSPVNKAKLVEWYLYPDYTAETGSLTFYAQNSLDLTNWTTLSAAIVNLNSYTDSVVYALSYDDPLYYRVKLVDGTRTFYSDPYNIYGTLSLREWLMFHETQRLMYRTLYNFGAGSQGYMLRRKLWGTRCTVCMDYDMEAIVGAATCATCYGVGLVGGYYAAKDFYFSMQPGYGTQKDVQIPLAVQNPHMVKAWGVAYPEVNTFDILVAKESAKRYLVKNVVNTGHIKGEPATQEFILEELAPQVIEYSIPLT